MKLSVKDLADFIGGEVFGDSDFQVTSVAKIQEANAGDLTFLYLPAYSKYLDSTHASVVLLSPDFERKRNDLIYIVHRNPNVAFQKIIRKFFTPEVKLESIDSSASIHSSALIGNNVAIGKNVVISANCRVGDNSKIFHNVVLLENVEVGNDTIIYPNVTVREDCKIGNSVIIHSGTVIGSDGFGYSPNADGSYEKIPQIGNVVIEDEVEIGSNVSIDRAALGSTLIKKGTKIDNLVQVAHNVVIGENTAISAQTGIAGSTTIGNNCILAGQVGIVGHIEITDKVIVGAQSGISKSLTKSGKYFGTPAKEMAQSLRLEAHVRNLEVYAARIKKLEKRISELESNNISDTKGNQ
ncbi:MAG: UDP-3-O-(3-hydroxymyristoyl)glucosamine N-acyltransferase [Ignavibacteriales bacterium]